MRRIAFIAILIASPLVFAKQDIDKVNGAVRTEAGAEYGSLETVNGSITVRAGVRADSASTVNGSIEIAADAILGEVETVNGGIDIGTGVLVERDVETVNGAIAIERGSRIEGKVETVNGRIELEGAEIGNGITTVNGDITVGTDSIVRGGILVEEPKGSSWFNFGKKQRVPRVVIGPNATVEGVLDFEREVELFVHETARIGTVRGAEPRRFSGRTP